MGLNVVEGDGVGRTMTAALAAAGACPCRGAWAACWRILPAAGQPMPSVLIVPRPHVAWPVVHRQDRLAPHDVSRDHHLLPVRLWYRRLGSPNSRQGNERDAQPSTLKSAASPGLWSMAWPPGRCKRAGVGDERLGLQGDQTLDRAARQGLDRCWSLRRYGPSAVKSFFLSFAEAPLGTGSWPSPRQPVRLRRSGLDEIDFRTQFPSFQVQGVCPSMPQPITATSSGSLLRRARTLALPALPPTKLALFRESPVRARCHITNYIESTCAHTAGIKLALSCILASRAAARPPCRRTSCCRPPTTQVHIPRPSPAVQD